MSIKPILFNTAMAEAILNDEKTTTRRLIKVKPNKKADLMYKEGVLKPPYQLGDILYVRETWNISNMDIEKNTITFIYKAEEAREDFSARTITVPEALWNKYNETMAENNPEWRPSIHMPKEAARIYLKVKDVHIEHLQDIDDNGIIAEGLEIGADFDKLWDSTIKKSNLATYGWEANPWVWVIEFEKCEKPKEWI